MDDLARIIVELRAAALALGAFGVAVRTRDANYPIASIGQLMSTLGGLQAAP